MSQQIISQAFHFPDRTLNDKHDLGLAARLEKNAQGEWELVISARRLARWVHIKDDHYYAATEWFHLPANQERHISLIARRAGIQKAPEGELCAVNATFSVRYELA